MRLLLGFLVLISTFSLQVSAQIPQIERDALITLYNSTDGANWSDNTGWLGAAGTECTWYGISCSSTHVINLGLSSNQLSGTIPAEIGNLSDLYSLYLNSNSLTGSLPAELGNLSALGGLYLSGNNFSGEIPPELGGLSSLNLLYLNSNMLSGKIPPELGTLSNLSYLYLSENRLVGGIPPELGSLTELLYLHMESNMLRGEFPPAFMGLVNLVAGFSDFGYNALWTKDAAMQTFLDNADYYWDDTQTIAPAGISVDTVTDSGATVHWTPITYSIDPGAYEIGIPSRLFADDFETGDQSQWGAEMAQLLPSTFTTADKTCSSIVLSGLAANTEYQFVVRTVTEVHFYNESVVISNPSEVVTFRTLE